MLCLMVRLQNDRTQNPNCDGVVIVPVPGSGEGDGPVPGPVSGEGDGPAPESDLTKRDAPVGVPAASCTYKTGVSPSVCLFLAVVYLCRSLPSVISP